MIPGKLHLRLKSLWSDIRESVQGTEQDFTTGRISRAILLLSIPMVLEMVMESVFALVDIFFVSRLGPGAVVTVGITESLLTIIYALAVGFSVGTTALISRRIGEKNSEGAAVGAVQAILVGIMMAVVIGITGAVFSKDFLRLMGATPDIVESGYMYTRIMMGGNIVIMLLFIINAVFRSAGDAAISMRVLWIANIINIILDPCLIFGWGPFPELGIKGAAVATNIGRGLAVVYQLFLLFRGRGRVKILSKHLRFNFTVMGKLIRLSLGGIGQNIIATSSWIGMVRIIAVFGSNVLAGYTIAIRIIVFALLPAWGLGNAAATLVGQNLGANKPDRAERSVWLAGYANMIFLGLIALFLIINPAFFIKLFIDNEQVINAGATCLRIVSYGFLFYGMGMIVIQALNGAGDTMTPTKINFFCFWLLEIPLAYLLAITIGIQEKGVYISIVVSESVMTLAGLYFFRLGKWKLKKV